jgi:hypothetical protein
MLIFAIPNDYFVIRSIGSRDAFVTFYRGYNNARICTGCFSGTLEEFEAAFAKTHGDNKYGVEYRAAIELAKARFGEAKP